MEDDVNFSGGRLRLTAFLRVVENDMPKRPARFKRRVPLDEQLSQALKHNFLGDADPSAPTTPTQSGPLGLVLQNRHARKNTNDSDAAQGGASLESGAGVQQVFFAQAGSEYDIPRSPTPADPSMDSGDHSTSDSFDRLITDEDRTVTITTLDRTFALPQSTQVQGVTGKTQGSSSTRKRRLPVQSLALLRTTTTDGLPDPSDAENVFATPIMEVDPIDDSQMSTAFTVKTRIQGSKLSYTPCLAKKSSVLVGQAFRKSSSRPVRFLKGPSSILPQLSPSTELTTHHPNRTQFVADGFEDDELNIVCARKSRRQAKPAPQEVKPTLAVAGLSMASGLLPTPAALYESTSVPSGSVKARPMNTEPDTHINGDHADPSNLPGQLKQTKSQDTSDIGQRQHNNQDRRWESAIRGQLLSITAPVRRESESSESNVTTRSPSIDGEEDNDANSLDNSSSCHESALRTRRPASVEEQRYFENAMHYLDIEEVTGSVEDDFWSQYNAME